MPKKMKIGSVINFRDLSEEDIRELFPKDKVAFRKGLPTVERYHQVREEEIDEEARTISFPFSSEIEVARWGWVEVLGHKKGEIDLERLNNEHPYLMDHNWRDQRGVIVKAWVEEDRGHCTVKLSRNKAGKELLRDHIDRIRTHVSVGYMIHEMVLEREEDELRYYRVTKWEPYEVSSVAVPADPSVGLGRSADDTDLNQNREVSTMPKEKAKDENLEEGAEGTRSQAKPAAAKPTDERQPAAAAAAEQQDDAKRIAETADKYDCPELGNEFIRGGKSYDQFREALTASLNEKRSDSNSMSTSMDLDIPNADLRNYSIVRAMREQIAPGQKDAGLEREVSNAYSERVGDNPDGIYIPHEVAGYVLRSHLQRQLATRAQAAGTTGKGEELVATELHSELFIEALKARAVLGQLGMRMMYGLVGNVDIPKLTGSASFYWVGEDTEPTESDLDFSVVQLRPNTLAGRVAITRRMLLQSSMSIEGLVVDDMLTELALAVDTTSLTGSGSGSEPQGIIGASGIGAVDISGGIDWDKMVELETDVLEANAAINQNSMGYLCRPTVNGTLKTTPKVAAQAIYLAENGRMNDYPVVPTTKMVAGDVLFGDYSQAMWGMWGALDVVRDTSTKVATGGVVMRIFQDADFALRHAGSFSYADNGV